MKTYAAGLYPTYKAGNQGKDPLRAVLFCGPSPAVIEDAAAHFWTMVSGLPDLAGRPIQTIESSAIVADPSLLRDLLQTSPLFGKAPCLWITGAVDTLATPLQKTLEALPVEGRGVSPHLLIVKGGDLARRSRLRTFFEEAPDLLAVLCYPLDARILRARLQADLAPHTFTPEAMALLVEALSNEDLVYLQEIEKLRLWMMNRPSGDAITIEDVTAVMAAGQGGDGIQALTNAFNQRISPLAALDLCWQEGMTPVGVLRLALTHLRRLMDLRSLSEHMSLSLALGKLTPPAWPREQSALEHAMHLWSAQDLHHTLEILLGSELACKKNSFFAEELCTASLYKAFLKQHSSGQ